MSFIADPIANFLSTYGTRLARIFNTNAKIPLACAITPTGTALGGAGTVGDEEFLTNFATAAGLSGQDAARAFDLSGPIPLMCMVNPDGTPYESYSAPYTEISFTWYQAGTAAPVIVSQNSSPDVTITPVYEETGYFGFTLPAGTLTDTTPEKVEVLANEFTISPGLRSLAYVIGGDTIACYVRDPANSFAAIDVVGDLAGSQYISTIIRIYP